MQQREGMNITAKRGTIEAVKSLERAVLSSGSMAHLASNPSSDLLAVLQLTYLKNRIVTRIKWANIYKKHNIAQSKCYVSVKLNTMLNSLSFNIIESFYLWILGVFPQVFLHFD